MTVRDGQELGAEATRGEMQTLPQTRGQGVWVMHLAEISFLGQSKVGRVDLKG